MNNNSQIEIWKKCLDSIKNSISVEDYSTWFKPIKFIELVDDKITIEVPTPFFYEQIEDKYITQVRKAITEHLGDGAKLVYSISSKKTKVKKTKIPSQNTVNYTNRKESKYRNPFSIQEIDKVKINSQLNYSYTFDRLVEGDFNRLSRSAGLAIAKNPGGTSFNPLFIYGGVGLGKTHLVHAIGIEIEKNFPEKNILYVSSEKFYRQFVDSVKNNTRNEFIHFYQMLDVLIVDDIQFLSGKTATQNTFFHIFNHLHQNKKQIILTSDKPPVEIKDIEHRLLSRFKWGLSTDIQKPKLESRISILNDKLYKDGIEMDDIIIEYIAQNIKDNIRELEGSLISILAQASFTKQKINISLAESVVSRFVNTEKREFTIGFILKSISEYFKIEIEDIKSKSRKREIVQARQLAMYFSKKNTKASLKSIGSEIGGRNHATVLYACKTVEDIKDSDKVFKKYFQDLNKIISI